jgi:SAM-dependent methyltransferase
MKTLDIGCGRNKRAGAVGMDRDPGSSADIIHDLDVFPYPLQDDSFDEVLCHNVLEHISDVPGAMGEIWRAARAGATVEIISPFPSSRWFYSDPTHRRAFISKSFDFFIPGTPFHGHIPTKARFELLSVEYQKDACSWWDGRLLALANRFKDHYESYFMYSYQVHAIRFRLKALK